MASSSLRCYFHKQEDYRLYCKTCKDCICVKCVQEFHDGHNFCQLEHALFYIRREIETFPSIVADTKLCGVLNTLKERVVLFDEEQKEIKNVLKELRNCKQEIVSRMNTVTAAILTKSCEVLELIKETDSDESMKASAAQVCVSNYRQESIEIVDTDFELQCEPDACASNKVVDRDNEFENKKEYDIKEKKVKMQTLKEHYGDIVVPTDYVAPKENCIENNPTGIGAPMDREVYDNGLDCVESKEYRFQETDKIKLDIILGKKTGKGVTPGIIARETDLAYDFQAQGKNEVGENNREESKKFQSRNITEYVQLSPIKVSVTSFQVVEKDSDENLNDYEELNTNEPHDFESTLLKSTDEVLETDVGAQANVEIESDGNLNDYEEHKECEPQIYQSPIQKSSTDKARAQNVGSQLYEESQTDRNIFEETKEYDLQELNCTIYKSSKFDGSDFVETKECKLQIQDLTICTQKSSTSEALRINSKFQLNAKRDSDGNNFDIITSKLRSPMSPTTDVRGKDFEKQFESCMSNKSNSPDFQENGNKLLAKDDHVIKRNKHGRNYDNERRMTVHEMTEIFEKIQNFG